MQPPSFSFQDRLKRNALKNLKLLDEAGKVFIFLATVINFIKLKRRVKIVYEIVASRSRFSAVWGKAFVRFSIERNISSTLAATEAI